MKNTIGMKHTMEMYGINVTTTFRIDLSLVEKKLKLSWITVALLGTSLVIVIGLRVCVRLLLMLLSGEIDGV